MAKNAGAIVIEAVLGDDDLLSNARRMADAARSLDRSTRRLGGQLRATTGGYISAVSKSVQAVEALRDEQLLAFGDTARAWESARTRLNGLSLALYDLKRNTRDAFVPIVTAAAPALTALTNLLSRAVYGVGAFMAALTGQNAFLRATGEQRRFAGSLRQTTGAARALERQLASFDELDILRKGSGGVGGSGGAPGLLEAMGGKAWLAPIDAGIIAFGERLRKLFEAGDYDGVGRAIAEGLNGAIEKARALIRWENVGTSVTRVVDGFCAAFNGLVDGVRWTEVGGALGDGIDTVLRTANRLLKGVRFDRLGQAIGEGLSGAIEQIDFDVLGETLSRLLTVKLEVLANAAAAFDWQSLGGKLAQGLGSLVKTAAGTLEKIDWSDVARKMTQGLNRFIQQADWAQVGAFIGGRLSDALNALKTAVTQFDWSGAGKALSKCVNALVKKVDWTALGQWLNRTIQGLLDFGIDFLQGFDADGLADGIARALDEVDWDAIAQKLWTLLSTAMSKMGGFGSLLGIGGGTGGLGRCEAKIGIRLVKQGWTSLSGFVGDRLTAALSLAKRGWTSLSGFIGDSLDVSTGLVRSGWTSIGSFVGESTDVKTSLTRWGWSSIEDFVGDDVSVWTQLVKWGWSSIESFVGNTTSVWTALRKNGWSNILSYITGNNQGNITLLVNLATGAVSGALAGFKKKVLGGYISAGGIDHSFADGGAILDSGRASWWSGVRKYASGTRNAHGTLFVAGEAGPEIAGHINGRTEILNRSQLAQTMQAAVLNGMVAAMRGITFTVPVVATGGLTPYEVSAQIARSTTDLQSTLDANNEDLIQTIISVAGQIVAAIQRGERRSAAGGAGGLTAQQLIDEINRRTQMFSASPLKGV